MRTCVAALALLAAACAPDQPPATVGCDKLADCPQEQVCDQSISQCIDEPANRFIGGFQCTIMDYASQQASQQLEAAQVIGRIGSERWSLPATAYCILDGDTLSLGFSDILYEQYGLEVQLSATEAATGLVELKPCFGCFGCPGQCLDTAVMADNSSNSALGYSTSGSVRFSPPPTMGAQVTGYLDVSMLATASGNALYGTPCPDGLSDCGQQAQLNDGGDTSVCETVQSGPMCTNACTGNGDCLVGNGTCVGGLCTTSCTSNADCTAPLKCLARGLGDAGAGKGCF
jgi:hypothetical protein